MKKTIKCYMSELVVFDKNEQRSQYESDIENYYNKKIRYLWWNEGTSVDFFSKKEARQFFKEMSK